MLYQNPDLKKILLLDTQLDTMVMFKWATAVRLRAVHERRPSPVGARASPIGKIIWLLSG